MLELKVEVLLDQIMRARRQQVQPLILRRLYLFPEVDLVALQYPDQAAAFLARLRVQKVMQIRVKHF
ncbi:hypothetical protein D1872_333460 [compost metagenome]